MSRPSSHRAPAIPPSPDLVAARWAAPLLIDHALTGFWATWPDPVQPWWAPRGGPAAGRLVIVPRALARAIVFAWTVGRTREHEHRRQIIDREEPPELQCAALHWQLLPGMSATLVRAAVGSSRHEKAVLLADGSRNEVWRWGSAETSAGWDRVVTFRDDASSAHRGERSLIIGRASRHRGAGPRE